MVEAYEQTPEEFTCLHCGSHKGRWHCPPRLDDDREDTCFWLVCRSCAALDNNDSDDRRVSPSQREEKK